MASMELVTGATGYVGGHLVERLAGEGRAVRALARDASRLDPPPGVERAEGDVLTGTGLEAALEGCSTAYYLVHSMELGDEEFAERDRRGAHAFGAAAAAAGVERIVYLGGIAPATGKPSAHLASRLEVEQILIDHVPASTGLRASIVIGAGSSSFRLLVRLVERLRVLPMPAWRKNRTQPIAERDIVEFLARTPQDPGSRRTRARHRRARRGHLRRDDRADRRADGRRPHADRVRRLADAARRLGRQRA